MFLVAWRLADRFLPLNRSTTTFFMFGSFVRFVANNHIRISSKFVGLDNILQYYNIALKGVQSLMRVSCCVAFSINFTSPLIP